MSHEQLSLPGMIDAMLPSTPHFRALFGPSADRWGPGLTQIGAVDCGTATLSPQNISILCQFGVETRLNHDGEHRGEPHGLLGI